MTLPTWVQDQRVTISGMGSIGRQHVRAFRAAGVKRITTFELDAERNQQLAEEFGTRAARSLADALSACDALVIAVPDQAHVEQLLAAADHTCAVLVEKPLATSAAEITAVRHRLLHVEDRIAVGYVLRHNQTLRSIAQLLTEGAVGQVTAAHVMLGSYETIAAARTRFLQVEKERLLRDYSHEWDYIRWLFGPVQRVLGYGRTVPSDVIEQPNAIDGLMQVDLDVMVAYHLDYLNKRGNRSLHVIGTDGSLAANVDEGRIEVKTVKGDYLIEQAADPALALREQANNLLAMAAGEAAPAATLQDGIDALLVAEAISKSIMGGATWKTVEAANEAGAPDRDGIDR